MIAAILFHHNEGRVAELEPLAASVHLVDALAKAIVAEDDSSLEETVLPESLRQLGLDLDDLPGLLDRSRMLFTGIPI
jgi:hypothetical protein